VNIEGEEIVLQGLQGQALGQVAKRVRALDGIEENAERIERIANMVEQFSDRFYSSPGVGEAACQPVPSGYSGQLERLTGATERLDKAVQRLTEIG
jgi:hypothetical protein